MEALIPVAFVLFFVAIVVGFVFLAINANKRAKERTAALAAMATRLGLQFAPDSAPPRPDVHDWFGTFKVGDNRRLLNTVYGNRAYDGKPCHVVMGDYRYTTTSGTGKDRRTVTHYLGYLIAQLPFGPTPSMYVRPENFFDKFAGAIGFEDIDFESIDFSKRFHVKSDNKRFAYDVIDPRMIEFLMAAPPVTFEINGGWLLTTQGEKTWSPAEFEAALAWYETFLSHWPTHVRNSLERSA